MLNTFDLDHYAFEIRYPNAYRIWDTAGRVASGLSDRYKDELRLTKAEPNLLSFVLSKKTTLEIRIDRLNFVVHQPPSDFAKEPVELEFIIDQAAENLNIKQITRLGTRQVFRRDFKDRMEMSKFFERYEFSKSVSGKNFNVNANLVLPSLYMQVEDDELGYHFRMSAKTDRTALEPGPSVKGIESIDKENFYAAIDIDLYTVGILPFSSFRVRDWLDRVSRAVRRDADKILTNLEGI